MEDEIYTYYMDMPPSIRSFVISHGNSSYTIMLNARICYEQQLLAYQHELNHIINGDYIKFNSVDLMELAAHGTKQLFKSKYANREEK